MKRLLLLLALAACDPTLYAASVPPPGAIGRLDSDDRWAELTQGAALAFRCGDTPCKRARAVSDDPSIAEVLPAALARLDLAGLDGFAPSSTFVLVGKRPGKTTIRVTSKDGDVNLRVTVLPPP